MAANTDDTNSSNTEQQHPPNQNQSPIFEGLSLEEPSILSVSFASDPSASLGVQLANHDNGLTNEMFSPGYASVGGVVDGDENSLAKQFGVKVGDYIVAVNGEGYRRFPPDFQDEELADVTKGLDLINLSDTNDDDDGGDDEQDNEQNAEDATQQKRELKGRVIPSGKNGEAYGQLLNKIREVKSMKSPTNPLVLSLERYMWDSRVHSWSRFLSARQGEATLRGTIAPK